MIIEITAEKRSVTTGDNKRKVVQVAYAHTLNREGQSKPHAEEITLWRNEGDEYAPGMYKMLPQSVGVYNKKLSVQPILERIERQPKP